MTADGRPSCRTPRRPVAVAGLVALMVLTGTGLAHALWAASATTNATVAAGVLTAAVGGTDRLTAENITSTGYTNPVELTLHNTSTVPLDYTLDLTPGAGTLDPAEIHLVLWERTSSACPSTVPTTGTVTGTLAAPPALPTETATGAAGSSTAVCAATRFAGTLFGSAGKTLTTTPDVTGRLRATSWSTTAVGAAFTHTMAPAPAAVTSLTCTDRDVLNLLGVVVGGEGIRLAWDAVPNATGYQVRSAAGATLTQVGTTSADLAQDVNPGSSVQVAAVGPTGYSPAMSYPVHRNSLLGLRCGSG